MSASFSFRNGRLHYQEQPLTDQQVSDLKSLIESTDTEMAARLHVRREWLRRPSAHVAIQGNERSA